MIISIEYRAKAVGLSFDDEIVTLLKGTGARRLGGGCCLFGNCERDIQFSVPAKNVKEAKSRLQMLSHTVPKANLNFSVDE